MKDITISIEKYDELLRDSYFLSALRDAGVDNWDGYDEARSIFQEYLEMEAKLGKVLEAEVDKVFVQLTKECKRLLK